MSDASASCWAPNQSVEAGARWSMTEPAAPDAELETVVVLPVAEHAVTVTHTVVQLEVALPEIEVAAQDAVHLDAADALHEDDETDEEPDNVLELEDTALDDVPVEDTKFVLTDGVGLLFESGKSPSRGKISRTTQGGNTPPGSGGIIPEITGNTR
jgi:hypothetical protein